MTFTANFNPLTAPPPMVHTGHEFLVPTAYHHHIPIISRPISFTFFKTPPNSLLFSAVAPIKSASNFSSTNTPGPETIFSSKLVLPFLKTSFIATAVAAAALFFSRTHFFSCKPAIASPAVSSTVESTSDDTLSDEEKEKSLEKHLLSHPNDVEALQRLMEIRIRNGKTEDSTRIVEKLIELEPEELEWPLMKAHMHTYAGETELARKGFIEVISKDPLKVEAYHGLMVAASQDDMSIEEFKAIQMSIEEAMKLCEREKKNNILRDFKLLRAQIYVIESKYDDALLLYKQLALEDPSDFRPYLCQGILFTVKKNKKEAEKNFQKYRALVPKEHPYATYFEDNMIATKAFAQEMEKERA